MTNTCCLFAVFVGVSALSSLLAAQSVPAVVAQPQVENNKIVEIVLLDNGRVLQGEVNRTFDQVHVQTAAGSRIVLQSKRVAQIFDSLSAAFQHRESKLDGDDISGHLSLFHWCLKHRLNAEAQQQLDRLMQTEIDARQLQYLDRQLVRTFEPLQPAADKAEPTKGVAGKSLGYLDVDPVFSSLPTVKHEEILMPAVMVDRAVALASHTEPTGNKAKETSEIDSARTQLEMSVQGELDSMTDLLNRQDLHQFQRRVQPVLLKGCLAAKCHNSTAAVMPLFHRGRGQLVPKRFTQRNLLSIMERITPNDIDHSVLLTQSVTSHGGQKAPAFEVGSREFHLLSDWLRHVVKNSPDLVSGISKSSKLGTISVVGIELGDSEGSAIEKSGHHAGALKRKKPARDLLDPVVDPFDPSVFNRLPK